jgi:hypothetical protein
MDSFWVMMGSNFPTYNPASNLTTPAEFGGGCFVFGGIDSAPPPIVAKLQLSTPPDGRTDPGRTDGPRTDGRTPDGRTDPAGPRRGPGSGPGSIRTLQLADYQSIAADLFCNLLIFKQLDPSGLSPQFFELSFYA